ncbi:MAG: hypothetical protein KDB61_15775, partial [Planctomycetes bacterium]|nr:hypothetical protein [Planctomycetota bacterium]
MHPGPNLIRALALLSCVAFLVAGVVYAKPEWSGPLFTATGLLAGVILIWVVWDGLRPAWKCTPLVQRRGATTFALALPQEWSVVVESTSKRPQNVELWEDVTNHC